jgi:hypothetical protein
MSKARVAIDIVVRLHTSLLWCMLVIDMALRRNASFPEKGGGCCTASMFMVKYLATLQLPPLQYCCKDRHTTIIKHRENSTHEIPWETFGNTQILTNLACWSYTLKKTSNPIMRI